MAAMKNLKELFAGKTFVKADGTKVSADEVLSKSVVGIYFSAHWCPPCRGFTPVLKDAYNSEKLKGNVEFVFVSRDRSEDDALAYMKESHGDWVMADYDDDDLGDALRKGCKVNGIPALHFFKDGEHRTDKGRELISGKKYDDILNLDPELFAPKKLPQLIEGKEFVKADGTVVPAAAVASKSLVGVYFSAHWCPPCKTFTPKLRDAYKDGKFGEDSEIIFISADKDEDAALAYMKESHGDWVKAKNDDTELQQALVEACDVSGIPALHFYKNGVHKTGEGRSLVESGKFEDIKNL